jgi:hypothetical protein
MFGRVVFYVVRVVLKGTSYFIFILVSKLGSNPVSFEYDANMTRLSSDQQPRNTVYILHNSVSKQCQQNIGIIKPSYGNCSVKLLLRVSRVVSDIEMQRNPAHALSIIKQFACVFIDKTEE